MGLLSLFGGKKEKAPTGSVTNPKEVEFVFKNASVENARVEITFSGDDAAYETKFLEYGVEKGKPHLAIGPLEPEDGNGILVRRKVFDVHFQYRDTPYAFRSALIGPLDGGCFKIGTAPYLLRSQKRSYFRIVPSYQDPIFVSFMVGGKSYKEKVEDLSEGGFSFSTNLDKDVLKPGMVMENTVLYLPDDTLFTTVVLRAHFSNKESTATQFKCGIQFQRLDQNDTQALARYVFKRQREMLQEEKTAKKA